MIAGLVNDIETSVLSEFICWHICAWTFMVRFRYWSGFVLIHGRASLSVGGNQGITICLGIYLSENIVYVAQVQ